MQLEELGLKPRRSMFSRIGIISEMTGAYPRRNKSEYKAMRLPSLYDGVRSVTPLAERINQAVKEAEASLVEARKKAKEEIKAEQSCSFTAVSREHLDSLQRSDSPTPTKYNPQFQYLMRSSPKVMISKPRVLKPISVPRSMSVENRSSASVYSVASEVNLKPRGVRFEKQLPRQALINKFEGADFVYLASDAIMNPKKTHSFSHYLGHRELFKQQRPLLDYDPKYSFVSRPRPPPIHKELLLLNS
jgi:signal recognition particle subunit SEC65